MIRREAEKIGSSKKQSENGSEEDRGGEVFTALVREKNKGENK